MPEDLLYQIALTLIPNIGPVQAKLLLQHLEAKEIFNCPKSMLEKIEGIGSTRAAAIKAFSDFKRATDEIELIEKYRIQPLFISDKGYPQRLLHCYDSPTLLYYHGKADLNCSRIIAVIGTRNHTEYGKQVTEKLIRDLAAFNVTVVSGLAYGIDAIAHKSAIRNQLFTVGVLAHGLDQVYPTDHCNLARDIINEGGGLLTEFRIYSKPDKHHFPTRNRIVAGMCDATIVIETGVKGGSMITAGLANSYNKDVFAIPGKITDTKSAGCNQLIKDNKATLLTVADELIDMMNWRDRPVKVKKQVELFVELSAEEKKIVAIVRDDEPVHIDKIYFKSGLSNSSIAAAILHLELQNLIVSLPGKLYRMA